MMSLRSRRRVVRKPVILAAAVAVMALVAAACQPTKPPPPQNTHRDILVLGDSLAAGIGCQLGDPGQPSEPPFPSCPGRPGITTANGWLGACSISGGWLHLYGTAGQNYPNGPPSATNQPNCHNWRQLFPGVLSAVTPELVILMTGGWEIVDRWTNLPGGCSAANITTCSPGADRQWGSTTSNLNANAVAGYRTNLLEAITMFANAGADVLVVNSPYIDPPTPGNLPDPIYWEPYDQSPPSWSALQFGYFNVPYRAPNNATPYKPSENKVDAFNTALAQIAANDFPNFSNDVRLFDLWDYVSPQIGGDREFSTDVCVSTSNPLDLNVLRSDPAACPSGSELVAVRHPDGGHFLADGYLLAVEAMLPTIQQMLA